MRELRHLINEDHAIDGTSPGYMGTLVEADPVLAQVVINAPTTGDDGRSPWYWLRLPNGDLMLACFPQGDTYLATETDPERP